MWKNHLQLLFFFIIIRSKPLIFTVWGVNPPELKCFTLKTGFVYLYLSILAQICYLK